MSFTDQEADQIFGEALRLDTGERGRYVEECCGDRPDLLAAVEELIALADATDPALDDAEDLRWRWMRDAEDHFIDPADGRRIGPYRLLREIGRGGMGVVYLAERADGQFEKRVAIKVVQGGRAERHARFTRERQILADLEHPGIARLLDGGVTDEGWPYLAMEYVDGEPIDRYCERHALPIRERIFLFLEVCRAVRAAHEVLVIHRDLKPGNIFVTQAGSRSTDTDGTSSTGSPARDPGEAPSDVSREHSRQPVKLLDFGIAKLLEPETEESGDSGGVAAPTTRMMTPAYASPEQFRGEPLGVASDIYQLGLLLHRLLVGSLPYQAQRVSPDEAARLICVQPPPSPSRHYLVRTRRQGQPISAAVKRWHRTLRGDLDNIVAMALAKHPEERYRSVDLLMADLGAYLHGRPVSARRQTLLYQLTRFVGRHRLAAATASVLALVLMGLTAAYTVSLRAERDRAEAALEESEIVSGLLVDLFEVSDPERTPEEPIDALALLDRGSERLLSGTNSSLEASSPLARARFLQTVGEIYTKLAQFDRAAESIEQALRLRIEQLPAEDGRVLESQNQLGALYSRLSRFEEAEDLLRRVLAVREARYRPGDPDAGERLAVTLNNLANLRWRQGRLEDAERLHRRALELRERHLAPEHVRIADTVNNLGVLALSQGDYEEAVRQLRRATDLFATLYGEDHPQRAVALNNLALAEAQLARWSDAQKNLEEVIRLWTAAYGPDHPRTLKARHNLGDLFRRRGDLEMSAAELRQTRRLQQQTETPEALEIARTAAVLGVVLGDLGQYEEADATLREALRIRRREFGDNHPSTLAIHGYLARVLFLRGRHAEAAEAQARVLADKIRLRGSHHPATDSSRVELAETLIELRRTDEARPLLETALADLRARLPADHPDVVEVETLLDLLDR